MLNLVNNFMISVLRVPSIIKSVDIETALYKKKVKTQLFKKNNHYQYTTQFLKINVSIYLNQKFACTSAWKSEKICKNYDKAI